MPTTELDLSTTALPVCALPYKFTGKERDTESGNDYFGARYYASSMGRWLSPDPLGMAFADPNNPQSLNRYAYVLNNPLVFTDPDGLDCIYLNSAGNGVAENGVDHNSNISECLGTDNNGNINGSNGGYRVNGNVNASDVSANADTGAVNVGNAEVFSWQDGGVRGSEFGQSLTVNAPANPMLQTQSITLGGIHVTYNPNVQATIGPRNLTPRPPLPTPGDCAADPDTAVAAHQIAMQAWRAQNGLPDSGPAPGDDDTGGGGGTGGAFLAFRPNGSQVLPSLSGAMGNEAGAGGANGAALLADRFSGFVACRGQR